MASTQLSVSTTSSGTRTKWTTSFWVKRCSTGAEHSIFGSYLDNNNKDKIAFDSSDRLQFASFQAGGYSNGGNLVTNRVFRDVNAWYHIVLRWDTNNSTADDRMKIWVNGVEETSFSSRTNPTSGRESLINYTTYTRVGSNGSSGNYLDGFLSHIHFCDNYTYSASDFGSTDSTTGEWKINTAPSVSYGTTGFWWLKDSIATTDHSSNSNPFTVSAGTLTKTEDNPSNIFATLNPLKTLGTTNRIISNGNTKFYTGTTHWGTMLSTLAFSSGKYYCEVKLDAIQASAGYGALGITDATENYQSNDNIQQQSSFSAGCVTDHRSGQSACKVAGSTVSSGIGNFSNGDIVGIAADMDNKALYLHKNGTYITVGGVTGVPTSGSSKTGALTIPATCVDCMFSISSYTSDATSSVNFGNGYFGTTAVSSAENPDDGIGIFEYDVPAGYRALCTKSINAEEYS